MLRSRSSIGFTLIEMLLVVAIISLLIGILLPTLKYARQNTNDTKCETNLRALYQAAVQYSTDHARRMPSARRWVDDNGGQGWWWYEINEVRNGAFYNYMGRNDAAYVCPVFLETRSWWTTNYSGINYQQQTPAFTYSMNEYVSGDSGYTWQAIGGKPNIKNVVTINNNDKPAELCMFTDENAWIVPGYSNHPINNGAMGVGRHWSVGDLVDSIGSFHKAPGQNLNNGYSNVAFMDGHVGLVHISDTKKVVTPQRWKENDP